MRSVRRLVRAIVWPVLARINSFRRAFQNADRLLGLAEDLRRLGQLTVAGKPNINYFWQRFRDYELAMLNIKNFGYQLAQQAYASRSQFAPTGPTIVALACKPCTQSDIETEWYAFWAREMRCAPIYHRKLWEFCYIAQAAYNEGKLRPGMAALGFGCGEEPLPSLFAKYGVNVTATDLAPEASAGKGWMETGQHASTVTKIRRADICPDAERLNTIELRYADMNAIPKDLFGRFDFCWSSCALEHLGSIENGLSFIENSLATLKPGGVAIHTTEFNICDSGETIDNWPTVLFQRKHFVELATRLRRKGYGVADMDFNIGTGVLDTFIDIPPYDKNAYFDFSERLASLKLSVDGFVCTSYGLIVRAPSVS